MIRAAGLAAAALALLASPAAAQLVPGMRAPESPADAIDGAQAMLCTLAAAGRPTPGLNMGLIGGEGMTQLDGIPEALARFVPAAPTQKVVLLKAPGDPVWVVHDARTGRCGIYSFTAAAPVEAKLRAALDRPGAWKRSKKPVAGIDHSYEWKMAPGVRLLTEISIPDSAGEPLLVLVRPSK
jgi:hypothetical protein